MKLSSTRIALIAVFAAFQALLSVFPFTITIGTSGQITLGVIGGPLIGILLGPVSGGLSTLIGSLIGVFLNPAGALFGILTVLPPSIGALAAGCIKIRRSYIAGALILISLLVFYSHPYGREAYIFPWLHIVAMAIAFSPVAYVAGSAFESHKAGRLVLGIAVAAFVAVLTDHIAGTALAIWYFSPFITSPVLYAVMAIYPIERMVAFILATIIAVPVYLSLVRAGLIKLVERE